MRKLNAMIRIQLKDFFSRYTQQMNIKNPILRRMIVVLPLLILMPMVIMTSTLYKTFSLIGMPELTMTYSYVIATFFAFVTAIPLVISIYFYAKDLGLVATLPVSENTIVFSKLTTIYVYLVAISIGFFGVSVGFYSFMDGFKPLSLLIGIIVTLLLPLMPMILAVLVILPFMSFIGGKKKRNLMVIVGNIVLLVMILTVQMLFTRMEMNPAEMEAFFLNEDSIMALIGHRFPPSVWATKVILGSASSGLAFLSINVAFVGILRIGSKWMYQGALTRYNQVSVSGKKGKIVYQSMSKRQLLVKRHVGIIINNPTFLLNTVLTILLPVLMVGIYMLTGQFDLDMLMHPSLRPYMALIFTGVIATPCLVGALSATAITREGKAFWETRVLPISVEDNLRARIECSMLIYMLGSIILGVLSIILMPLTLWDIIMAIFVCISATVFFSTVDLIINIKRPFLTWSNPTAAVKNNLNIMLALVLRLVIGAAGYGIYALTSQFSQYAFLGILTIMFILLSVIASYLVYGKFKQAFVDIVL